MKKIILMVLLMLPIITEAADFTASAKELVAVEKSNGAKFKLKFVGKMVSMKGKVDSVGETFFNFEASNTFGGLAVYIDDINFLADLSKGDIVEVECMVADLPLIGSALDECVSFKKL